MSEKTLGQIAAEAHDQEMDRAIGKNPMTARDGAWEAAAQAVRQAVLEEAAKLGCKGGMGNDPRRVATFQ